MDDKVFLGKYRIPGRETDAAGENTGDAVAYRAEEIDSGKKFVVELVATGPLDTAALERLAAEAIAAKKINHINIPELCAFGVEDDHLVYVTQDFEGTRADEWVSANGPMPVGPVLRVASQVVSALSAAAVHQIVHHAINPGNLLLAPGQTAEGEWPLVKVLHFVAATPKLSGNSLAVAAFDKSLHYVSPEQIKTGLVDFRSEIYSLGCTMWFLLTGAPPLLVPDGPNVLAPTIDGSKARNIPRKVRRLLGEMLSINPDARPRDPIEFYRKLQECLVQVDRREKLSRRFGVPVFFRAPMVDRPALRRFPMKALALAALFLTIATVAALVVPGYLRHRRIVSGDEPLGVVIGVPEAVANAASDKANTPNTLASNPGPKAGPVAQSNISPSALAERTEAVNKNTLATPIDSFANTDTNQITNGPQPASQGSSPNPQEPVAVIASNVAPPPPDDNPSATTSAPMAIADPTESAPDVVAQTTPPSVAQHGTRRAEPAEPEVRRAEPAPPEEAPESATSERTASSQPLTNATAQIEENRNGETNAAKKTTRTVKRSDPQSKAIARQRVRRTRPPQPRTPSGERIYLPADAMEFADARPPAPRRSVRARFVGVAPDGRWMLALPSNEIVLVPPPPGHRR